MNSAPAFRSAESAEFLRFFHIHCIKQGLEKYGGKISMSIMFSHRMSYFVGNTFLSGKKADKKTGRYIYSFTFRNMDTRSILVATSIWG